MSAYFTTHISGDESYGGYITVDGARSFYIKQDMVYELTPGQHNFYIRSIGDKNWQIDFIIHEGQCIELSVLSNGNSVVGTPMYNIKDLDEAELAYYHGIFEEIHRKEEEKRKREEEAREKRRNTPRRSPVKIVFGSIITVYGFGFTLASAISLTSLSEASEYGQTMIPTLLVVGLALLIIGLSLFINGVKKKIRK